jgi:thymidylate synthase ThyX
LIDLNFPSALIVAHSKAPNGEEILTYEVELHRFILPEANTHRSLSRNYQSSRAVPVLKQLEQIANDPAMPVYYGREQSGMIAGDELEGRDLELAKMIILGMRDACLNGVKQLQKLGLHKQISNRYVEPWMKTKGVVTATRKAFEAFFKLRVHFAAQPEIKLLAERMQTAMLQSVPNELKYGDYHLPYVNHSDFPASEFGLKKDLIAAKVKVSCSCAAQVSYRRLDDSLEKALKVYDMLNLPINGVYPDDPPHYSPTEHVVKIQAVDKELSGNFHSNTFFQYRKALEYGIEDKFLENTK